MAEANFQAAGLSSTVCERIRKRFGHLSLVPSLAAGIDADLAERHAACAEEVQVATDRPTAIEPCFEGIPAELRAIPNWVMWRYEPPDRLQQKWRKVPYQVKGIKASTTNRRTWNTFDACRAAFKQGGFDGIGFVFDKTIGPDGLCYFGVDFDKCVTNDEVAPYAKKQINKLDTYTELSVSGTGMHCIGRGKPLDRSINANGVEIYDTARYFTFTGQGTTRQIRAASDEVRALMAEVQANKTKRAVDPPEDIKIAERFAHLDPGKSLGAGIESHHWFDQLTPEHKDEVVDHALEVIASRTPFLKLREDGGDNDMYFQIATAVTRSGAPNANKSWLKHASAVKDADSDDKLLEMFDRCKKDPPSKCQGITVGTLLWLAQEYGADFDKWKHLEPPPAEPPSLDVWDAGEDTEVPPPREWLVGNSFCRRKVSSLIATTGVGKTSVRLLQGISLALGRSLTGEHVFVRTRVLIVCLEDDKDEVQRRIWAILLHYGINRADLKGWLFLSAPGTRGGKLLTVNSRTGALTAGTLGPLIEAEVSKHDIGLVIVDPLVKAHSVSENSNDEMDALAGLLTDLANKLNIAIDAPHHTSKGPADPGNPDRGRGASATNAAMRLVYSLTAMSSSEAERFGIGEDERRGYVRLDRAKLNPAPSTGPASWFKLVSVNIGNATATYPTGDDVQVAEIWNPPESWAGIDQDVINAILDTLDRGLGDGNYYSAHDNAAADRAAWAVVTHHAPHKNEEQARIIIKTWIKNGWLFKFNYKNSQTRKKAQGLKVNKDKRPT